MKQKSVCTDWSTLDSNSCKDNIPSFSLAASRTSNPAHILQKTCVIYTAKTVQQMNAAVLNML